MENHSGSRATTVAELEVILDNFWNESARIRGLAFKPNHDDIIISPYAKCGTTWVQQIVHGLRTQGSMEFEEIALVIPWIEVAYDMGLDLEAPQVAKPRVYKSHLSWYDVPKGGRYICTFRHYHDAMVSFYRFFEGWYFEPGTIDLETLVHWRWPRDKVDSQGYWYHLRSWWEQRDNKDVLLLCYEDMKVDLPGTVQKIAQFMGIPLDNSLLEIVVRQSSREFMLAHQSQFGERHLHDIGGKRANLPLPLSYSKVTNGTPDKNRYKLSSSTKQLLDDIWREQIGAKFNLATYEDLRLALDELY